MKILSHNQSQSYHHCAFNRGHILFTSLIQNENKLLFLDAHLDRLLQGADYLFPNENWTIKKELLKQAALEEMKNEKNHYLRMTLSEDSLWFEKKPRTYSAESLKVTRAVSLKTQGLKPTFLKVSNYLESDLELRKAKEDGFDDVLYFDLHQNATEATTSNVFLVNSKGVIKTPPLSSSVLSGIIRKKLLECLGKNGFDIVEENFSMLDLENAREIWLTNAVKGIRYVSQFQQSQFFKEPEIYKKAVDFFGRFGEKYE